MYINCDYKRRDKIIFGSYNPEQYIGGARDFNGLSPDKAKELVSLNYLDIEDHQNYSPTVEEFLDFVNSHEDFVLNGYVTGPNRKDYGTSIDAIEYMGKRHNITKELIEEFKAKFKDADILSASEDELYAWFD